MHHHLKWSTRARRFGVYTAGVCLTIVLLVGCSTPKSPASPTPAGGGQHQPEPAAQDNGQRNGDVTEPTPDSPGAAGPVVPTPAARDATLALARSNQSQVMDCLNGIDYTVGITGANKPLHWVVTDVHAAGNPHLQFLPDQGDLNPGATQTMRVTGSFDAELLPGSFWFTIASPQSTSSFTVELYCQH